LRVT